MFSIPILKQDIRINSRIIILAFGVQMFCLLLALGICEMKLIEISDIFFDTLPVVVIPAGMQMAIAYRLIAARMEDGTMSFLLSTPTKPAKILFTKMLFQIGLLAVFLGISEVFGAFTGLYSLTGVWSRSDFRHLYAGAFCLQFFLGGFCFLVSCLGKNFRSYIGLAVGVPLLFYLMYLGYYLFPQLFFLKYVTIFSLFQQSLFAKGSFWIWIFSAIYLILGAGCYFVSAHIFLRKEDSPL